MGVLSRDRQEPHIIVPGHVCNVCTYGQDGFSIFKETQIAGLANVHA